MAVSSSSYFGNAIVGVPQVGADIDIYEVNATPKYPVGFGFERSDGAKFRYVHYGTTAAAGRLFAQDVSESSLVDTDDVIIAPSATYKVPSEPGNIYPGSIGSHYVVITLASTTADQYAGGYFITTDDTGEGYTYRIIGNTATNDPATGKIRLQLYKPLKVALDATTDFCIVGSLYANLEIATAATDMWIAGVVMSAVGTAGYYGWVQTKGVVGILQDDSAVAVGDMVTLSDNVDGAVQVAAGGGTSISDLIAEHILGYCAIVGDSTGQSGIVLTGIE